MQFFDRKKEIAYLQTIEEQAKSVSQFTVLTGRRRIGKTSLVLHALKDTTFLYFFVSKKSEKELCQTFLMEINEKLHIPVLGEATSFADIFRYLMTLSETQPLTVFIDEFQEFLRINPSIYSDMQRIWDTQKDRSHIHLIVGGSVHSLIYKLFENSKEPLYNRQTAFLQLRGFTPSVLKEILSFYNPRYTQEDLLALYCLTGGVAKYVELLMDAGAVTKKRMIDYILHPTSIFLSEGRNMLIEEFGRDYGIYFSILSAVASGHTTRNQIEDIVGKEVSGYLTMLMDTYSLLYKHQPLFTSTRTNIRYQLKDNFLIFWFRFLYKYNYMLEIGAYDKLRQIILRDYETYSGKLLEQYFKEQLAEEGQYTQIGSWWSRNGEDEIDIIAIDELSRQATFYEVKRQQKNLDLSLLARRKDTFLTATRQLKGYTFEIKGLTMADM